jgi:NifU-like protein involved in Fe-S cluster formation
MPVLYNAEILRLATSIPHVGRLEWPDGTAERRSKTCGSLIIVDVVLDAQFCVARFGQSVSACALGQASAALLGRDIIGKTLGELVATRNALAAFLAGERPDCGDWPGLELFQSAVSHSARHAAILLPFEAAVEAAERAQH